MSKLRIVAENFSDASTLDATPTLALDINNLMEQGRAKVIRSNITDWNPTYNQEIAIIFPNIKTISAIVLGRHNFLADMGIKFILYDAIDFDDTTGVEIYNSGDLTVGIEESESEREAWGIFGWGAVGWGGKINPEDFAPTSNYVHWIPDGISDVYSMKIFFKVVNTLQLEIGRLIIGDYIQPIYNLNYKHKIEWKEDSKQYRTEASTLRSDIALPARKMEFALDTIHKDDRTKLLKGLRYIGLRKDFYINLFPDDTSTEKEKDYSGIMKITKEPIMSEYAPELYKSKYVMEEV